MSSLTKNLEKARLKTLPHKPILFAKSRKFSLFFGVFEELIDGILILTEQGELVYANASAGRICQQLVQGNSPPNLGTQDLGTQKIWPACQSLIENCISVFKPKTRIESEISVEKLGTFRLRVQWLRLEETDYQVILIEDCSQSLQNLVNSQVQTYGLTPREAEVWSLSRTHHTYREIAEQLYITLNTVKKHMKNIHAKFRVD